MQAYVRISVAAILAVVGLQAAFAQTESVDFPTARHIIAARCSFCHSAFPQEDGLNATTQPPKGVKFDTPADIQKFAPRILDQAVLSTRMPPNNATHMSDAERATLGKWLQAGARVP